MKNYIVLLILVFSSATVAAQKHDTQDSLLTSTHWLRTDIHIYKSKLKGKHYDPDKLLKKSDTVGYVFKNDGKAIWRQGNSKYPMIWERKGDKLKLKLSFYYAGGVYKFKIIKLTKDELVLRERKRKGDRIVTQSTFKAVEQLPLPKKEKE